LSMGAEEETHHGSTRIFTDQKPKSRSVFIRANPW
jgi:hypothetical protein